MSSPPRWFTDTNPGHAQWYIERFRTMAADGADLEGEARLVDALVPPRSRVLDAGCGPGRVAGALHARGHIAVGVDVDPELVAAAETDHPGPTYRVCDLAELDLDEEPFDLAVCAGNVLHFVAPDTERKVLERIAAQVRPDGKIVIGFRREDSYPYERFEDDAAAAGLRMEHRFATWDLAAAAPDEDGFAVYVLRVPPTS